MPLTGAPALVAIVAHAPVRLEAAIISPLATPAISAWPGLAVMDWTLWSSICEVGVPPLTGYSVSVEDGPPSVITLSAPYHVTPLNPLVRSLTLKNES